MPLRNHCSASMILFYDGDVKLNYDLTPRQNVNFYATGGHTDMNDPTAADFDSFASGRSDFTLARAGWRWSVSPRLLLDAWTAYFREPDELRNPEHHILTTNDYAERVGGSSLTWSWANDQVLEAETRIRYMTTNCIDVIQQTMKKKKAKAAGLQPWPRWFAG